MTSRPAGRSCSILGACAFPNCDCPAAPESDTPETDALLKRQVTGLISHTRSLERRLSLAQTEIKGHMRIAKEANQRTEEAIWELHNAEARIAELEKAIVGECEDCGQTILTPLHPLPSVEKDAARYRWLREHSTQPVEEWSTHSNPESLDAAIDAALKDHA